MIRFFTILVCLVLIQSSCFALNIAVVNVEKVFMSYEKTRDSDQSLKDKKDEKQQMLSDYEEKVKKMKDEYDANSEKYSEDRRKKEEDKLNAEIQNLQKLLQKYSKELQDLEGEMIDSIKDEILEAIKKIAADNKKDIVFEKSAVLSGGEDITDKVIEFLNNKYKKEKK